MRYAIISDIHANLQAWNAVLLDIRSLETDRIICLGDIVGYGPNPAEVLKSVHANVDDLVLGNHDAVICGKMDPSLFNDNAREIILWTKDQLNNNAIKFLKSLPLSLDGGSFRCAHGDFFDPAVFNYIIDPEEALPSWQTVDEQLLFVGHTHQPAIFLLGRSGTPRMVEAQDFELEPEKRFLVNVGSIGQPRDGEIRACYCIFDSDNGSICWRRIPFDLDAYRDALHGAGVSTEPSYFLRHDPRMGTPPLRKLLNFSPAATPDQAVKDAVEVQELKVLQHRVTKWKLLSSVILCLGIGLSLVAGSAWWRHHTRALDIRGVGSAAISALTVPYDKNILVTPKAPVSSGRPIPNWRVRLGDKRKQTISVASYSDQDEDGTGEDNVMFLFSSETMKDELGLLSPIVRVSPGMKLCMQAMFKKSDDFSGNITGVISLTKKTEGAEEIVDQFIVKEPNQSRRGGWFLAKQTFTLPANATSVELHVRGNFTGRVMVRDISLSRKK